MEVNVEIVGVDKVIARLRRVPGGARVALQYSILYALRRGRTEAARAARERYVIPYGWLLKAIGRPHISALSGWLNVSGTKAKLAEFPHRSIFPYGVAIQELKAGTPINLVHAFVHGPGPILERETPQTRRYPLRTLTGLSAPQMIAQKTQVFPNLQSKLEFHLNNELQRLTRLLLAGDIVPKESSS
jgi:hypothetical protein